MIFHCARPTRAFSGRALREHRRSSSPHPLLCSASKEGDHVCPRYFLIHANSFINRLFVRGVKFALRHKFTTFLFTSACVG